MWQLALACVLESELPLLLDVLVYQLGVAVGVVISSLAQSCIRQQQFYRSLRSSVSRDPSLRSGSRCSYLDKIGAPRRLH
jgi:hypothetical protein